MAGMKCFDSLSTNGFSIGSSQDGVRHFPHRKVARGMLDPFAEPQDDMPVLSVTEIETWLSQINDAG